MQSLLPKRIGYYKFQDVNWRRHLHKQLAWLPIENIKTVFGDLIKFATVSVEVRFNVIIYRQINGKAIGSLLGPAISNVFVRVLWTKKYSNNKTQIYCKYPILSVRKLYSNLRHLSTLLLNSICCDMRKKRLLAQVNWSCHLNRLIWSRNSRTCVPPEVVGFFFTFMNK